MINSEVNNFLSGLFPEVTHFPIWQTDQFWYKEFSKVKHFPNWSHVRNAVFPKWIRNDLFSDLTQLQSDLYCKAIGSEQFFEVQWGGGIMGHLLFTFVISHESEVYRFYKFKINILAELVHLIIFSLFLLFKTYWGRRFLALKCAITSFLANQGTTVP